MNRSQRNAIIRAIRYMRRSHAYDGVTSVRFANGGKPQAQRFGRISFGLVTRRSDCTRNSARGMVCEQQVQFWVGPRGSLEVLGAFDGISGTAAGNRLARHVAKMLGAKVGGCVGK
jgi:hypothetical protein